MISQANLLEAKRLERGWGKTAAKRYLEVCRGLTTGSSPRSAPPTKHKGRGSKKLTKEAVLNAVGLEWETSMTIADRLKFARVTVCRKLKALEEQGLVELKTSRYVYARRVKP